MIRNAYLKKVEDRFSKLSEEIESLRRKAETSSGEAKEVLGRQVESLRSGMETAKGRIRAVRASGAESWGGLKKGVDEALDDVRKAVDGAYQRFRKTGSDKR